MDRDQNWERTKRAYDAIVEREAKYEAESALEAVEAAYERDETDEFVEPTTIRGQPALEDGDNETSKASRAAAEAVNRIDGDERAVRQNTDSVTDRVDVL